MKFLNEVKIEGGVNPPSFLNTPTRTEDIVRVGTTGNQLTDMAFKTAIDFSKHIDGLKRGNENAKLKINLNKEIQDYESAWNAKDKYSDENYSDYKTGLEAIYERNKLAIASTHYTNEQDVISWENDTEQLKANALFKLQGEKANYSIKKELDETSLNADSLMKSYISTGDESLKTQAINMLDSLKNLGIPKHEIEQKKLKMLVDSDSNRLDVEINEIINNPSLSLEDKKQRLDTLRSNLANSATYEAYANQALDDKVISKDTYENLKNYSQNIYNERFLKAGGIVERLNDSIRDEQYRNEVRIENEKIRIENQINKDKYDVRTSFRNNNDIKGISILEGKNIDPSDMVNNESLSEKYYGDTPKGIIDRNEYIPTLTTFEINDMKNKARIDSGNGISRFDTVKSIYNNTDEMEDKERENYDRQLIANGVVDSFEVGILKGDLSPQGTTGENYINYKNLGNNYRNLNKLGGFVGIGVGGATKDFNDKFKTIKGDFYKVELLSELTVGAMISGEFGVVFDGVKGITTTTFRKAYNENASFRNYINNSIDLINKSDSKKYKKATMKKQNIDEVINKKYEEKGIKIRKEVKESGVEPVVENYYDFENF